jgi:hypothetical protein
MAIMYFRPQALNLGTSVLAFLNDIQASGKHTSMPDSSITLELSIEQEEARLRARLAKLAEFKRMAKELGIPLEAAAGVAASAEPVPTVSQSFDGTVAGLIKCYRTDDRSPYHTLRNAVRNGYDGIFNRLIGEIGYVRIGDLSGEKIKRLYAGWIEGGKIASGHSTVAKLRLLSTFGATVLGDHDCILFSGIMHSLRFKAPDARLEPMTAEYAKAIRAKAHEVGWHSIALAQAFQFELKLRPVDVVGEWVPISNSPTSGVIWGNEKWVRGLRWSDINEKMILEFTVLDRLKRIKQNKVDLMDLTMVREELDRLGRDIPMTGPLIICEATGRPFTNNEFRRKWRIVATKADVPDTVRNGDSIRSESNHKVVRKTVAGT